MVEHMTFNHYSTGSNPVSLKNGYRLMVDYSRTMWNMLIQLQLAIRVSNLIGKGFSCRENRYRIVADLTRGKVASRQGKIFAKYCVITLRCSTHLFSVKFLNLIG